MALIYHLKIYSFLAIKITQATGTEKKVLQRLIFHHFFIIFLLPYSVRAGMGKELLCSLVFGWEPANTEISSNISWENTK